MGGFLAALHTRQSLRGEALRTLRIANIDPNEEGGLMSRPMSLVVAILDLSPCVEELWLDCVGQLRVEDLGGRHCALTIH